MKFLFVGKDQIDFSKIGGIENSIKELANFLLKKGHKVIIFQIQDKNKHEVKNYYKQYKKIKIYTGTINNIRYKILQSKFDVINFVQTPFENIFFTLSFFLKKYFSNAISCKFFFTYPPFKHKYNYWQKFKYKFLIDKSFAFSRRLKNNISMKNHKAYFLYPPVSNHYSELNRIKGKKEKKIKILFAGRLSKDKGIEIVLNVFNKLDRRKYYLGMSGYFKSKKDSLYYSKFIEDLKIDYLNIIDYMSKSKKRLYIPLHKFDIILLPYQILSYTVDIPLLVLESLIAGCVVITSNIGDLSLLKGNIYTINEYSDYRNFLQTIKSIPIKNKKDFVLNKYLSNEVGNKYLSCIKK